MANATITAAWHDSARAYLAVSVVEVGRGNVEYVASTSLLDSTGQLKSNAQLKVDLTAACKLQRDTIISATPAPVTLPITGTVTL